MIHNLINSCYLFLCGNNAVSETVRAWIIFTAFLTALNLSDFLCLYLNKINKKLASPFLRSMSFYLVLTAPVLVLCDFSKIYIVAVIWVFGIIHISGIIAAYKFKLKLEGDMFDIIAVSSPQEIKEFFYRFTRPSILSGIIACVALLAIVSGFLCFRQYTTNMTMVLATFCLLVPFMIQFIHCVCKGNPSRAFTRNRITNLAVGYMINVKDNKLLSDMVKNPQVPGNIRIMDEKGHDMFGVIIIGESSSRKHYGLYGYPRNTTPALSAMKDELYVFKDAICTYGATALAIRHDFTFASFQNPEPKCSLVDILNMAGYEVDFISNQYRWGKYDGPVSMIFSHSAHKEYLTEKKRNSYDSELAARLDEIIAAGSRRKVVIMQMIGNHLEYNMRYPSDFGPFTGLRDNLNNRLDKYYAELLNEYDNSIAFTDSVLSTMINSLKKLTIPAFLLFFPDHGEIVENGMNTSRIGPSKNPEVYEIPLVTWLSEEYKSRFPGFVPQMSANMDKPIQTNDLIWSMADLARLRFDGFQSRRSIFSGDYSPVKRFICEGKIEYIKAEGLRDQGLRDLENNKTGVIGNRDA